MRRNPTTRRALMGGIGALAAGATVAGSARAQAPAMPSAPVALNIIDVAGDLQLTQKGFEAYRAANPKLVSRISFTQATAPELPETRRSRTPTASISTWC